MNRSTSLNASYDGTPLQSLAMVNLGEMAELLEVPVELASYVPSGSTFRRGEVVQCLGRDNGMLTVARANGSRVSIPERLGLLTPIRPFDLYGADDLFAIDPSADRRAVPRVRGFRS